jgi:magnesium-transporting ATPase (P-type)
MSNNFHSKTEEETLKEFSSHVSGLQKETAKERLKKFGFNEIPEKKGKIRY